MMKLRDRLIHAWMRFPRRFRLPLGLAWAATLAALGLAVGPNLGGDYDANLAVLTATLVTVVWYTYFTYRAVHREPATYLVTRLSFQPRRGFVVVPAIRNPMPWTVTARVHVDVWVDREPIDLGPFYRGEEPRPLDPQQGFSGWLNLNEHVPQHRETNGEVIWDVHTIHARMQVWWNDRLGEGGATLPHFLLWDIDAGEREVLVAPSDIAKHFHGLRQLNGVPLP